MNTIFFDVDMTTASVQTRNGVLSVVVKIPTIPAYAIEHSDLIVNGVGSKTGNFYIIEGDELICVQGTIGVNDVLRIIIHYHGIRDYRLLFPAVSDVGLVDRLANFYEESEKNFNAGAWLSFALMCGAIYEGLLFDKLNQNVKFQILINDACTNNLIDPHTAAIMHKTRNFRNLVHANRFSDPYVSRADAMDIKTTLDKLIKKFSR